MTPHKTKSFSAINPLSFGRVSEINLARCNEWHKGGLEEWSVSDWAVAMAGESGEICDAVKKLNRLRDTLKSNNERQPITEHEAIMNIAQEIGDTYLYLDLLAQRLGLNIQECIQDTFNRVSKRENLPYRL